MTLFHAGNLPEGFATIEDIWQRYIHTKNEEDAEGWLRTFQRRCAVKVFALNIAEDLDAEANGRYDIRDTHDGRIAVFVPPLDMRESLADVIKEYVEGRP